MGFESMTYRSAVDCPTTELLIPRHTESGSASAERTIATGPHQYCCCPTVVSDIHKDKIDSNTSEALISLAIEHPDARVRIYFSKIFSDVGGGGNL